MSKITDDIQESLRNILDETIKEDGLKRLKKVVEDFLCEIETDLDYRIKEDLGSNLSAYVVEMADKVIKAILEGRQDLMEQYLGCKEHAWTGRSDSPTYGAARDIGSWHPVIHGKLFEQGSVLLRRKIVDAHKDLITSQRILDLEDQVAALVEQVNKATKEREAMWERCRSYM